MDESEPRWVQPHRRSLGLARGSRHLGDGARDRDVAVMSSEGPPDPSPPSTPPTRPPSSDPRPLTIDDVPRLGSGSGIAIGCAVAGVLAVVVFWFVRGWFLSSP